MTSDWMNFGVRTVLIEELARLIFSPDLDFLSGSLVILTAWLLIFKTKAGVNNKIKQSFNFIV